MTFLTREKPELDNRALEEKYCEKTETYDDASPEIPDVHQVIVDGVIGSEHSSSEELLRSSPNHNQDRQQQTGLRRDQI